MRTSGRALDERVWWELLVRETELRVVLTCDSADAAAFADFEALLRELAAAGWAPTRAHAEDDEQWCWFQGALPAEAAERLAVSAVLAAAERR